MVVDRLGAEEQLGRRLAERVTLGEDQRDLQLARRQLVERGRRAPARGLARGEQLEPRPLRPWRRTEVLEALQRAAQLRSRLEPPAAATQRLAAAQPRARLLEAVR